jgi:hypothetical protein
MGTLNPSHPSTLPPYFHPSTSCHFQKHTEVLAINMESEVHSPNEYEARNKRIAQNAAKLESLGILPQIRYAPWSSPLLSEIEAPLN